MESTWLRDAMRSCLNATAFASADEGRGPPEQRDPRFRKLVQGILYSKRFIISYHLLVLAFVLLLSAVHWWEQNLRWRTRRARRLQILASDDAYGGVPGTVKAIPADEQASPGTSLSGSSTLEGTSSPPQKSGSESEITPLLHSQKMLRPPPSRKPLFSIIDAFLMYQPQPIPVFDKTLPSNGTTILLLAFIGLNIFYCLHHINFNLFELFVLADRFGLVFVANLPLLYLLAAKNQPLRFLTGWSYESLNIFHRRLGELMCVEALFHFLGMTGVWYTLLRPGGSTLVEFFFGRVILLGLLAFVAYELLYLTSLGSFRQRWYELFLGLHVFLQAAALILVFFHHPASRVYVGAALFIFIVDRIVFRLGIKSTTTVAEVSVLPDGETVKLSTNVVKQPSTILTRFGTRSIYEGWSGTDHVFVTVPCLARKHIIQAHPFTIASAPPKADEEETRLELIIRAQDGFSADLLNKARHHKHLMVRLDGPYGSAHARHMLEDADVAIVVAGGSGIAVAWPLVQHLLDVTRSTDTEIVPTSLLRRQKVFLIWVVHKSTHISWIGLEQLAKIEDKGVDVIIPPPTEEVGRPDLAFLLSGLVATTGEGKKINVVASGPDSMGRRVRNTCALLRKDGSDISVLIEKFGW
ncbi:hypothetical protein BP6252_09375 [Coleophoma cylindrospora]|uniref:FAD-binding FR-type domain-containing protein n=1 Tax=Coleophoma cylindrospora TaxID=1849047 RepID=A0A3D8R1R2_9HELO|nr:hypothetical protein BP6252_09375 [Coleophoma cylindrospora]